MKKQFNFFSYLLLSLSLIIFACSKDKDEPDNPTDTTEPVSFSASVNSNATDVNGSLTFTDSSTGVSSRQWTFPLGSPATSSDAEVSVTFAHGGPVVATLDLTFNDGTTETKNFPVQIGNELYSRLIFGFEDEAKLGAINSTSGDTWKTWNSSGNEDVTVSVDNTQGANNTPSSLKVVFNQTGNEAQIFTKENNNNPINAELESNTTYTFSFYIKSDDVESITAGQLENLKVVDGEQIQGWKGFVYISPVYLTNEWVKISQVFETGDLSETYTEGRALNAFAQFKFIPETTGTLYIDEISLVEGDQGSFNNPAPKSFNPTVSSNKISVGDSVTFTDNSTGASSRTWSFPGGNPSTSTEASQEVTFAAAGSYTCSVEVSFIDGTTENQEFVIEVGDLGSGKELYDQDFFGFESNSSLASWTLWNSSGNEDVTASIVNDGANGSSYSVQLTVNNDSGNEVQLLSRDTAGVNATLSAGKTYVFSYWAKSTDGVSVSNARVFVGDNNPFTQYFWTDGGISSTSEWVKFSTTFQAQDPFVQDNADNVFVQFTLYPAGSGTLLIDEISLVEIE